MHTDARIDAYIASAADFAQPILTHLRALVHEACPDVEEGWKWSFPHFMYKGAVMCSMAGFKSHCAFGFWKAALMDDAAGALTVKDRESMGHLGRITSLADLPPDDVLIGLVKTAMQLNEEGKKMPRKPKPAASEQAMLATPEWFAAALEQEPVAKTHFEKFSYSHRKEYIEWLADAKTEATRQKRMAQAIEWLRDGKGRNWKYQ